VRSSAALSGVKRANMSAVPAQKASASMPVPGSARCSMKSASVCATFRPARSIMRSVMQSTPCYAVLLRLSNYAV